jgi:IPT/TIG domain
MIGHRTLNRVVAITATVVVGVAMAVAAAPAFAASHPTVTEVGPNIGSHDGGTRVEVDGTGFTDVSYVLFGTLHASSFTVVSSTELQAIAPANKPGSFADVRVVTAHGTSAVADGDGYHWKRIAHARAFGLTPAFGPYPGGNTIEVSGTGFKDVTAVEFGHTLTTDFTVQSLTDLTVVAPRHAPGRVEVHVIRTGVTSFGTGSFYTYIGPPTVTNVSPNAGALAGGSQVSIIGTGFTDVTSVLFGTTRAPSFTITTVQAPTPDTIITAVVPKHSSGRTDIRIVTKHGTSAIVANLARYTYTAAPRALKLTTARTIDENTLIGISCPAASFCAAYDTAGRVVTNRNGTWQHPAPIAGQVGGIVSISCTSASFCMASDATAHVFAWNGTAWSLSATFTGGTPWPVSCASPTFCGAAGQDGYAEIFNGTSWSGEEQIENDGFVHLTGMSCPVVGFCYAAGVDALNYPVPPGGNANSASLVAAYHNGVWDFPTDFDTHEILGSISCAQANFCAVGTAAGARVLTDASNPALDEAENWSPDLPLRGPSGAGAPASTVDCSNATFCLTYWQDAATGLKHWVRSDGASFATQGFTVLHPGSFPTAVSCWARYSCQFVGGTDTYRSS